MISKYRIKAPGGETKILLHACCAPCSSAIVEYLLANNVRPTLFYFNPNIYPHEEYEKRKAECIRHAQLLGLQFIDAENNSLSTELKSLTGFLNAQCSTLNSGHAAWLEAVRGLEGEPERGARCLQCFRLRLTATASFAAENGFKVFATTLASSRWKDLNQIQEAGEAAAASFPNLIFWAQNWRKGGLSERRNELIRTYGFYNQSYCGCEFSI